MPVVRGAMNADNRPEWSGVTSAGIFWVSAKDGRFDNHYHDCDEYWLIFKGKAKVMVKVYQKHWTNICGMHLVKNETCSKQQKI